MNVKGNPFIKRKKEKKNHFLANIITIIALFITFIALVYFFILTPNEVNGPSMLPNFKDGEFLLVSRPHAWLYGTDFTRNFGLKFQRGDVVVFSQNNEGDIVKRIIGLPGDSIRMVGGEFIINGKAADEQFETLNYEKKDGDFIKNGGNSVTLKADEFFLVGDNRDLSFDSRSLGPINLKHIKGKVIVKILPFEIVQTGMLKIN